MGMCMAVCLSLLVLQQTGNLSRVHPASLPMVAGIGPACNPELDKQKKMDGEIIKSTSEVI